MFETIIVKPIFNLLIGIYSLIPGADFGIALIIFTIIIRFLLYPLVKKQLHQTKVMRKIQPELAKLKAKSKGNKQVEAMQMMELYKKHGVSPFRTMGILLIQLPIFIGLFQVIQIFTNHRDQLEKFTYNFLENFEPIREIVQNPDKFNHNMLGFIDLTNTAFSGGRIDIVLVVLAILSGITQYFMSKQTMPQQDSKKTFSQIMSEAAEGKQADQSELNAIVMNNMIKIMPFFMVFIMLSVPGALALYYATSNIIAVVQQHFILKQDEEELEEIAEEANITQPRKKATVKAREKQAVEAKITRIKAKDNKKTKGVKNG